MRKDGRREKVREAGSVLAFEVAAWSVSGPVKYAREYERPSICRLSVRLPVPLPPKLAIERLLQPTPELLPPPSLSLSISQPVQFNERTAAMHTYETIHTDLPRLSIARPDSLATFARLERVFPKGW